MKKIISILLVLCMVLSVSSVALAANGDVVGYIYSTDIRAFVNGVGVESYNIGGKTAIVIEDILRENSNQYNYDDATRTLKFFSLNPDYLVEGKANNSSKPGKIVGKIYDTDIKTSIYDVVIPTYNIGGKTAVAIEDLGYDGAFSPIGGKFVWNEVERTISLEFLYGNYHNLSSDRNVAITANETVTEAEATFEEVLHCGGMHVDYIFPEYVTDNAKLETIMPIKANGEIIGYYFCRALADESLKTFTYWYPEKVKEAEDKNCKPYPYISKEDTIAHFLNYHCIGDPVEQFDTDDYSFVYISVAGTSWTSYNLLQVFNDGTYIDYDDEISTRNRSPQNLVIDRENEKVTFKYVDRYTSEWFTNYEIDLKSGIIKEIKNNVTVDDANEDVYKTFEEVTGLSRENVVHIFITNLGDGIEHRVDEENQISTIYNAINTDSFFRTTRNGSGGGLGEKIIFFDKNNLSYTYRIGNGVVNEKGIHIMVEENELREVIAEVCSVTTN